MKYIECRKKTIEEVMREFKQGKLKSSSGKKVTNEKQALAIALSMAQQCSFSKSEANQIYQNNLDKLNQGKMNLTILNEINELVDYFYLNKEKGKRNYLINKTLSVFLLKGKKGVKIDNNMWEVIYDIYHL
jgi:ATP:corrinoid adenosyltransferase